MGAVTMFHTKSGRTQRASRGAFERLWKAQGWVLVESQPEPEPPHAPPDGDRGPELTSEPAEPQASDRLADLRAEAQALGLKVHPASKAETVARKIAEAKAAE